MRKKKEQEKNKKQKPGNNGEIKKRRWQRQEKGEMKGETTPKGAQD